MVVRLLVVVLCSYVAVCLALYLWQEKLLFYPESLPPDFRYTFPGPFDEVTLLVEGAALNALHFRAERPQGVVLYLHGNAGSLRTWGSVASDFIVHGYDVFILDYRGYGKSTGRITRERVLHEDVALAYAYLQRRYAEEEIVVYGRSLGSGLAAYLARSNRPRMLILETPYYSIEELARASFPFAPSFLLKYPLHTDRWIGEVACPVYFFHGTWDEFIPHTSSERLARLVETEHELFIIEGGGHNDLSEFEQYDEGLARILR
ncbi:MAG: alpha/beta hydrolase [Anaerolineae bacterium]